MEILHLQELGDMEKDVTNVVLLFMWSLTIFCSICSF